MAYKDKYIHIKKQTIEVIRALIKRGGYYKFEDNHKYTLLALTLMTLNRIYETSTRLEETTRGSSYYNHLNKTIYLDKASVVSFLHEYKHSLQHQKGKQNSEDIARGWSVSLFALASPYHYERAKRKELLFFD